MFFFVTVTCRSNFLETTVESFALSTNDGSHVTVRTQDCLVQTYGQKEERTVIENMALTSN